MSKLINDIVENNENLSNFDKNINKYIDLISTLSFYPDLFYDLISPKTGGIRLDLDQRIILRCLSRFLHNYIVTSRAFSKTLLNLMAMYHVAIFHPDIELALTAQTKDNAISILEDKHREIIKYYPKMENEITYYNFNKENCKVVFTSGGVIDILSNTQASKGQRRKRINIEESALLNNELFEDVLEPIPSIARRTIGEKAVVNPEELNGSINFFTTPGFKGTSEHERNISMTDDMAKLKGTMVIGADWQIPAYTGRGETKSKILEKKDKLSPIYFTQNYAARWVGSKTGSIVRIDNLISLREVSKPELESDGKSEYILSMDVARSEKGNNDCSIAVLKIIRDKKNKVSQVKLVNLINLPGNYNFTKQAIELKRLKNKYEAKKIVIDYNGLGRGVVDEVLKENIDPITGENLGCWATENTEQEPESDDAEEIVHCLNSTHINNDIIVNFMNMVESRKLKLLVKHKDIYSIEDNSDHYKNKILPHAQTDLLIEEVSNLKIKKKANGGLGEIQISKKLNKDRYSALVYGLYYIMQNENDYQQDKELKATDYLFIN